MGTTCHASTVKPNIHGKKLMLCIWWDQLGVVWVAQTERDHYSLKSNTIDEPSTQGKTRPGYYSRHNKIILLHDNARPHVAAPVETLKTLKWEILPHPPYSPVYLRISRHCSFQLLLVPIDDAWPVWAALHIIWRYQKLYRWIVSKMKRSSAVSTCYQKDGKK